jgi:hypothetical protein
LLYRTSLPIKVKGELGDWTLSGRIDILEMISDKEVKIGDIKATSAYQVQTLRKELNTFGWSDDWRDLNINTSINLMLMLKV